MAAANFDDSSYFWEINANERYSKLFNNEFLSDVSFIIGKEGTRVPGHSFVLILCSWDFYNAFKLLKLDNYEFVIDVPETSFMAFLEYCYTHALDLSMDNTSLGKTLDILKLSQRFHMKTLEEICLEHVTDVSSILSTNNCMDIYKNMATLPRDSSVLNTALHYIGENFREIFKVEKNINIFLDLSLEEVMNFEKRCILCDKKDWFDVLIKWAKKACEKQNLPPLGKNLKMVLGDLFYKIRFPSMSATWILEMLANYSGVPTTEEISKISRETNDHTVDCPELDPIPQLQYESYYKPVLFGMTLNCFEGPLKMDRSMTYELRSRFGFERWRRDFIDLVGFAFVAKRNEVINVISCKFKIEHDTNCLLDDYNMDITPINPFGRYRVNEEYDLIAMRFEQICRLTHHGADDQAWLHCKFDKAVPNLSAGGYVYKAHIRSGLWRYVNDVDAIPYLIFAHFL